MHVRRVHLYASKSFGAVALIAALCSTVACVLSLHFAVSSSFSHHIALSTHISTGCGSCRCSRPVRAECTRGSCCRRPGRHEAQQYDGARRGGHHGCATACAHARRLLISRFSVWAVLQTDPQERAKTTTASSGCRPRPTAPDPGVPHGKSQVQATTGLTNVGEATDTPLRNTRAQSRNIDV